MDSKLDLDLNNDTEVAGYVRNCIEKNQKIDKIVWADYFLKPQPKRNSFLVKVYKEKKKYFRQWYNFLEESQINGKTLKYFGIPHFCGSVSRDFLSSFSYLKKSKTDGTKTTAEADSKKKNKTTSQKSYLDNFKDEPVPLKKYSEIQTTHLSKHSFNKCPDDCMLRGDHSDCESVWTSISEINVSQADYLDENIEINNEQNEYQRKQPSKQGGFLGLEQEYDLIGRMETNTQPKPTSLKENINTRNIKEQNRYQGERPSKYSKFLRDKLRPEPADRMDEPKNFKENKNINNSHDDQTQSIFTPVNQTDEQVLKTYRKKKLYTSPLNLSGSPLENTAENTLPGTPHFSNSDKNNSHSIHDEAMISFIKNLEISCKNESLKVCLDPKISNILAAHKDEMKNKPPPLQEKNSFQSKKHRTTKKVESKSVKNPGKRSKKQQKTEEDLSKILIKKAIAESKKQIKNKRKNSMKNSDEKELEQKREIATDRSFVNVSIKLEGLNLDTRSQKNENKENIAPSKSTAENNVEQKKKQRKPIEKKLSEKSLTSSTTQNRIDADDMDTTDVRPPSEMTHTIGSPTFSIGSFNSDEFNSSFTMGDNQSYLQTENDRLKEQPTAERTTNSNKKSEIDLSEFNDILTRMKREEDEDQDSLLFMKAMNFNDNDDDGQAESIIPASSTNSVITLPSSGQELSNRSVVIKQEFSIDENEQIQNEEIDTQKELEKQTKIAADKITMIKDVSVRLEKLNLEAYYHTIKNEESVVSSSCVDEKKKQHKSIGKRSNDESIEKRLSAKSFSSFMDQESMDIEEMNSGNRSSGEVTHVSGSPTFNDQTEVDLKEKDVSKTRSDSVLTHVSQSPVSSDHSSLIIGLSQNRIDSKQVNPHNRRPHSVLSHVSESSINSDRSSKSDKLNQNRVDSKVTETPNKGPNSVLSHISESSIFSDHSPVSDEPNRKEINLKGTATPKKGPNSVLSHISESSIFSDHSPISAEPNRKRVDSKGTDTPNKGPNSVLSHISESSIFSDHSPISDEQNRKRIDSKGTDTPKKGPNSVLSHISESSIFSDHSFINNEPNQSGTISKVTDTFNKRPNSVLTHVSESSVNSNYSSTINDLTQSQFNSTKSSISNKRPNSVLTHISESSIFSEFSSELNESNLKITRTSDRADFKTQGHPPQEQSTENREKQSELNSTILNKFLKELSQEEDDENDSFMKEMNFKHRQDELREDVQSVSRASSINSSTVIPSSSQESLSISQRNIKFNEIPLSQPTVDFDITLTPLIPINKTLSGQAREINQDLDSENSEIHEDIFIPKDRSSINIQDNLFSDKSSSLIKGDVYNFKLNSSSESSASFSEIFKPNKKLGSEPGKKVRSKTSSTPKNASLSLEEAPPFITNIKNRNFLSFENLSEFSGFDSEKEKDISLNFRDLDISKNKSDLPSKTDENSSLKIDDFSKITDNLSENDKKNSGYFQSLLNSKILLKPQNRNKSLTSKETLQRKNKQILKENSEINRNNRVQTQRSNNENQPTLNRKRNKPTSGLSFLEKTKQNLLQTNDESSDREFAKSFKTSQSSSDGGFLFKKDSSKKNSKNKAKTSKKKKQDESLDEDDSIYELYKNLNKPKSNSSGDSKSNIFSSNFSLDKTPSYPSELDKIIPKKNQKDQTVQKEDDNGNKEIKSEFSYPSDWVPSDWSESGFYEKNPFEGDIARKFSKKPTAPKKPFSCKRQEKFKDMDCDQGLQSNAAKRGSTKKQKIESSKNEKGPLSRFSSSSFNFNFSSDNSQSGLSDDKCFKRDMKSYFKSHRGTSSESLSAKKIFQTISDNISADNDSASESCFKLNFE